MLERGFSKMNLKDNDVNDYDNDDSDIDAPTTRQQQ